MEEKIKELALLRASLKEKEKNYYWNENKNKTYFKAKKKRKKIEKQLFKTLEQWMSY